MYFYTWGPVGPLRRGGRGCWCFTATNATVVPPQRHFRWGNIGNLQEQATNGRFCLYIGLGAVRPSISLLCELMALTLSRFDHDSPRNKFPVTSSRCTNQWTWRCNDERCHRSAFPVRTDVLQARDPCGQRQLERLDFVWGEPDHSCLRPI